MYQLTKKNSVALDSVNVFDLEGFYLSCGVSTYKDALIVWDDDYDNRIFEAIDILSGKMTLKDSIFQEHEGGLLIRTKSTRKPEDVELKKDCDYWTITYI